MAGEWEKRPLAELCSYLSRGAAPAYVASGGLLVLNQRCIREQRVVFEFARRTDSHRKPVSDERQVRPLDILVNSTGVGTLGRVAQVRELPEPATVDSHVTILRPNPEAIYPLFLGLAVRCFEPAIEALGEGSTGQTELSRTRLGAFRVPVPDRPEQRAIAHILGTLDDKIEIARRMSATLDAMARALFRSWFVDFDPVRAKAEGRDPGLPEHLAALFPSRLLESELGEVPEGWEVKPIVAEYDAVKGVSYKGSGLADSGTPLHNLNSIYEGGGYKYEGIKYYTGEHRERHVVLPGDVIVANTEQGHDRLLIGYAAIVPRLFGQGIASHHIYRMRPKPGCTRSSVFLYHLLNSSRMHDVVSGYANGTTVNMLPQVGVEQPLMVSPPAPVEDLFSVFAMNCELRREEVVSEGRSLAGLRDALLPKLISGELRVPDAEAFLERVT